MGKVFISYAHADEAKAAKIKTRLDDLGFQCWIDRSAPATLDDISSVIDKEISKVDSVLVLWSDASRSSVWVRGEALSGLSGNKYFGLLLTAMVPPVPFNALVAPDLCDWTGLHDHLGWDALVRGLAAMSASAASIVAKLDAAQLKERAEAAQLASAQPSLPLDPKDEPLDQGPSYTDVEAITSAAHSILGGAAKHDLSFALLQATLDQEMLRDAAFVVSASNDVPRPRGARFEIVPKIQQALAKAKEDDLIVVVPGTYDECLFISKSVRLVGLGNGSQKPTIRAANGDRSAVAFTTSARIENFSIETRFKYHAVHCGAGQPVILRCDIRRFAEKSEHAAFYVAGKANPIVIACSLASTGCPAMYFVQHSGGQFMGLHVISVRGAAVSCRGRPTFKGCTIEAIGAHAIEAAPGGSPDFQECEISGRGASVVVVSGNSYPKIKESRVSSIRQLVFDFEANASGVIEGNIISLEKGADAGSGKKERSGFFGLLKSKEDAIVRAAINRDEFVRLRSGARTIFVSNTTPDGDILDGPSPSKVN